VIAPCLRSDSRRRLAASGTLVGVSMVAVPVTELWVLLACS
jgi:hypothetical protein